jgi:DNA-binding LacI/PurR family transcriptional regulator
VSYALNGDPDGRLTEATRQRVLEAAERIGYAPSAAARLLRGGRSRSVLLLTPDVHGGGGMTPAVVEELAAALAREGFSLVWQLGIEGSAAPVRELSPAVVLTSPTTDDLEFERLTRGFTVPVISAFTGRDGFVAAAGTAQVRALADRGFTRLTFARPPDPRLDPMVALRRAAVEHEAAILGLAPVHAVEWPEDRADGRRLLESLVDRDAVLAIAAYNDDVALAVLAAAADAGLTVPARISVIGVDDVPAARLAVPALTTVRADLRRYVQDLAAAVIALAGGGTADPPALPSQLELVERASVGHGPMTVRRSPPGSTPHASR